jgi:hypothetical protein
MPINGPVLEARRVSWVPRLLLGLLLLAMAAGPAWAHASDKGIVLLLPTGYYIVGGALAVAVSFLLLLAVPNDWLRRWIGCRLDLGTWPAIPRVGVSAAVFILLVLLLITGWYGSRDPLENPLPLFVWTLWWGGLTIAHALFGNLWHGLNPWLAPYRLVRRLMGRREGEGLWRYPAWLGYGPAILFFLGFAWFELVEPAPDDPSLLADAILVYSIVTWAGMALFGERAWLAKAECFSVFFGFVALLAPFQAEPVPVSAGSTEPRRYRLTLGLPGRALLQREPLPLDGTAFVLLTLATVSFDGLKMTFWWLGLWGVNPLEFPGRSAVMPASSLGLLAMWVALGLIYLLVIALGFRQAGGRTGLKPTLGRFVLTLLPISIGFHFAHYLTSFLVNAQYALFSVNDPFEAEWHLLGMEEPHVWVSFLSDMNSVWVIFSLQAGAVVLAHLLAVLLSHLMAIDFQPGRRAVFASQWPLALFMIAYTLFGLWLLSAPNAG